MIVAAVIAALMLLAMGALPIAAFVLLWPFRDSYPRAVLRWLRLCIYRSRLPKWKPLPAPHWKREPFGPRRLYAPSGSVWLHHPDRATFVNRVTGEERTYEDIVDARRPAA